MSARNPLLFVDDMAMRHDVFMELWKDKGDDIQQAYGYRDAIAIMRATPAFDIIFLDHDLSIADIMVDPDGRSHVPTGTDIAKWMASNPVDVGVVIIHTANPAGAARMDGILSDAGYKTQVLPFHRLIEEFA